MAIASIDQTMDGLAVRRKPQTFLSVFRRQFLKNRGATVGAVVLLIVVAAAILAPALAPYNPLAMHPKDRLLAPSSQYLFGTDQYGRDILSRILHGARISLQVGVIANLVAVTFGILFGLAGGYYGGTLDLILMRIMDMIFAFPSILLALSIIGLVGQRSLSWVMIALAITWIPVYARLIRGSVLSTKEAAYIEAARVVGMSDVRIIARHILPNVIAPIIVVMTLLVGVAIRNAAALSFLGMGAQPPTPEWGLMLFETKQYMRLAPWVTIFPGLAILLTVMAFNLIGDGLRTALDPRMKID